MQQQYIVITAQCSIQPSLVGELAKLAASSGCSIINSRMDTLGREFVMMMLLSGSWDAVAKVESGLQLLEKRLDMRVMSRRTQMRERTEDLLPYSVQVVALDRAGIIQKMTEFFDGQGIFIEEMYSDTYNTATQTVMFSLTISINIPASCHLASVRERFLLFCDDHNLDAIIEPIKG